MGGAPEIGGAVRATGDLKELQIACERLMEVAARVGGPAEKIIADATHDALLTQGQHTVTWAYYVSRLRNAMILGRSDAEEAFRASLRELAELCPAATAEEFKRRFPEAFWK